MPLGFGSTSGQLGFGRQFVAAGSAAVLAGNWDGVRIYYDHNHSDPVSATVAWSSDGSNFNNIGTTDQIASGNIGYISATWASVGRKRYWRLTFTDPSDGNIGGQSDQILEVDWRENGSYITSSSAKTAHNAIITTNNIGGTLSTDYDGNTGTGTTSISEGSYLLFDFGS